MWLTCRLLRRHNLVAAGMSVRLAYISQGFKDWRRCWWVFCFVFLHAKNLEEELREGCFILGSSSKTSDAKKKVAALLCSRCWLFCQAHQGQVFLRFNISTDVFVLKGCLAELISECDIISLLRSLQRLCLCIECVFVWLWNKTGQNKRSEWCMSGLYRGGLRKHPCTVSIWSLKKETVLEPWWPKKKKREQNKDES